MVDLVNVRKFLLDRPEMYHQQKYDETLKRVVDDPTCRCRKCNMKVMKIGNPQ